MIVFLKNNRPHCKDLEQLYGQKYEVISTKREIKMDLPLQLGVAVYHVAKLRMLEFYYTVAPSWCGLGCRSRTLMVEYISPHFFIDRSDFQMCQMDTDSNYFAFSEDDIEQLIKPKMREEHQRDKIICLPSERKNLHPTFQVDGVRFTCAQYDKESLVF